MINDNYTRISPYPEMARLFGTNGVRGVFGEDLTLEVIHDLVVAISRHFGPGSILVGYDGRHSGQTVARMVRATLSYMGRDSHDVGLVPTPCLEYCVRQLGYAGGIMITASHNPPEYNGIKPVAPDGVEISRDQEDIIEQLYHQGFDHTKPDRWGTVRPELRAIDTYASGVLSQVDAEAICDHHYTVALDLGNGAQAVTAPLICQRLGCKVIQIHSDVDGSFPGRGSEPTPDNLAILSETVQKSGADLGVAFDGDGDRSMLCDENGTILTGDASAHLLLQHLLSGNPGSTVVTCLNSSSAIETLTSRYGSSVIRTPVGSVSVSRMMSSVSAVAGFEENGGFMYGPHNPVRDGSMTMALALDAMESSGRTISEMVSTLPVSFTAKTKISCAPESIPSLMESLHADHPDADTTDGIKIIFAPNNWVMIRPSGTEPVVRIYAESFSYASLQSLIREYETHVHGILDS